MCPSSTPSSTTCCPSPRRRCGTASRAPDLILITSQEIDELGEADNITQARRQMDGVLNDLRRGFRVLADLGIKTHRPRRRPRSSVRRRDRRGHEDRSPWWRDGDLHRRVWVGVGGTSEPSYLRTSLESLGVDSDLDLATPWTFACFKSKGGARAYFHGGLSPQELIIPVVVMTPTAQALSKPPTGIQWTLTTGSKKLSTRFFSVQVAGRAAGCSALSRPRCGSKCEPRASASRCRSAPPTASRRPPAKCSSSFRHGRPADRAEYRDPDGRCR